MSGIHTTIVKIYEIKSDQLVINIVIVNSRIADETHV